MANVADKEWLVDYVIQCLMSPSWTEPIQEFITQKCTLFDLSDPEENKFEYTMLHNEFKQIVESLLAAHFLQVDVTPEEFAVVCDACCNVDERLQQVAAQLASVDDFLTFKRMMAARYKQLFGAFAFEQQQLDGSQTAATYGQGDSAAPAPKHEVLEYIQQGQADLSTTNPSASLDTAQSAAQVPVADEAEVGPLPPMPQLRLPQLPRRSSSVALPKVSASRIAAIVASAARSKTNDQDKAALLETTSNTRLTVVRGGGC
jgi:hypothetical protein